MEDEGAPAIFKRVKIVTEVLAKANEPSLEDIAVINQTLDELQNLVAGCVKKRLRNISGTQLMNAGVKLYNSPRAFLKALEDITKQVDGKISSFPRYSLALTRFVAAKIMRLSLMSSCDYAGEKLTDGKNVQLMDEYLDVLRSFGRIGMLMFESATVDCDRCEEYLSLAKDSYSSSMHLWYCIGLSHLTKFKQGVELEDIIDDLWDICSGRVRVLQLLIKRSNNSSDEFRDVLSSLHELKMLTPYKVTYAISLLDLIKWVSDEYRHSAHLELQKLFIEEALRIGDSIDDNIDGNFPHLLTQFKQHVLLNLLHSLCASGDLTRAETCYQLIPDNQKPKVLLLMNKLYVDNQQFEKAHRLLQLLFRQNCFEDSISGARIFAQGFSFADKALDIYRELADNYGDKEFIINLDVACNLAFVEGKRQESVKELKRIGCALMEKQRSGEYVEIDHLLRIRQTINAALQEALNSNRHEDCLMWADAALAVVLTLKDKAMYMRMTARSCVELGRTLAALEWAKKAFAAENSKKSLLGVFHAAIKAEPEGSYTILKSIMKQLKSRDDFEINDLLALGQIASHIDPSRQDIFTLIMDELCEILLETGCFPAKTPVGVILQNAAQLAFSNSRHQQEVEFGVHATSSFTEKFLTYTNALLLRPARSDPLEIQVAFGPSTVFEWFFRMSFDIAKGTEDSRYFVVAANIAERSDEIFGENSPLMHRSQQCLLAAVSSDMKKIETLDQSQLLGVLEVINRIGCFQDKVASVAATIMCYLAKAMIAIKLRLRDANTSEIFELCKATHHSVPDLLEIGGTS